MSGVLSQAFVFIFSLFALCFITCVLCGLALFFWKLPRINAAFKHPLLANRPFRQYAFSIQAGILLDYFLHLIMPRATRWVAGYANQQLRHVDAKMLPLDVKWPIIGFWGSCFLGLIAMISLWVILLLGR